MKTSPKLTILLCVMCDVPIACVAMVIDRRYVVPREYYTGVCCLHCASVRSFRAAEPPGLINHSTCKRPRHTQAEAGPIDGVDSHRSRNHTTLVDTSIPTRWVAGMALLVACWRPSATVLLCKDVSRELIAGARNRCSVQLLGMGHSASSPAAGR